MSKEQSVGMDFKKFLRDHPDELVEHLKSKLTGIEKKNLDRTGPVLQWIQECEPIEGVALPMDDLSTGIPTLTRGVQNLTFGIATLAGQPNAGKSTFIVQCIRDLLRQNSDCIVVDLTLDDAADARYTQLICNFAGLDYGKVSMPNFMNNTEKGMYTTARAELFGYIDTKRYWMLEGGESFTIQGKTYDANFYSYKSVYRLFDAFRSAYPESKIVFTVDAMNDLESDSYETGKMDELLKRLRDTAKEFEIIVFMSAHLRKMENRRAGIMTLDDLKGTKSIEYISKWIGLLSNEYKENPLSDYIRLERGNKEYPIITIRQPKNKASSWDGVLMYGLDRHRCRLLPLTKEEYIEVRQQYLYNGAR